MKKIELKGEPNPRQLDFFIANGRHIAYGGARGGGKAQPITEPILTPGGYKPMSDIKINSFVIGSNGLPAKVNQIHPQGEKDIYEVEFIDGASTRVTLDHLWLAKRSGGRYKKKVYTTQELIDLNSKGINILIPLVNPIEYVKKELSIKPYTLGMLLGDGCLVKPHETTFTTADKEIIENIINDGYKVNKRKSSYCYSIVDFSKENKYLNDYNLKVKSDLKYIPDEYKYSCINDRLQLIQGLFDTDGYVDNRGHIEFTTVSFKLAKDVQELIWSIGGKCTIKQHSSSYLKNGERIKCKEKYRLYIRTKIDKSLFRLTRKKERCKEIFNGGVSELQRRIISIKYIGKEICQCITVDNEDGLYVTKDYILTHNSWAMRRKFVLLAMRYEGLQILLLRRTLPELRENHILPLQQELYGFANYKDSEKSFVFPNGSRIKLGYCDNESDVYQYQGQEYDVIGMEEATHFTDSQRVFLSTCNRSTRTDFSPRMYYTANPGGVGHVWFKRLFIDRDYQAKEKPEHYIFIPAKVYDNTVLMENNPEYVEILENLPEDLRRAHLDGDWDALAGQYFREFRREIHTIDAFEIPKEWRRYRTVDYGLDMCACYWVALSPTRKAYVYRELHQPNLIISEAANMIKSMTPDDEEIYTTFLPPDLYNRRQDTGKSAADIFYENGIKHQKSINDRILGWYNMKEWLMVYNTRDEQTGEEYKTSNLVIFKNCVNLAKHIPQLQSDDKEPNDVATEPHDITHSCDAIRYFCATYSRPSKEEKEQLSGNYFKTELLMKGFKPYQIKNLVKSGKVKLLGD
jgi:phage terminase large subunit